MPELDTPDLKRTLFIIPAEVAKNRTDNARPRLLVLNDAAQRIVDSQRGMHPQFVFTYQDQKGERDRFYAVRNSGWLGARRRASERYESELHRPCPAGFRSLRAHDMRHTFGRRLRAAGVSFEDRQDLLGHHAGRVTTEYSAAEVGNFIEAANGVIKSRESPERTMLRVVWA